MKCSIDYISRVIQRKRLVFFACAVFLFFLPGCGAYIEGTQESFATFSPVLTAEKKGIGQTLVTNQDGWNGVQIYLKPGGNCQNGQLHLTVLNSPTSDTVLRESVLPAGAVTTPAFYSFNFTPIHSSSGQYYYISLTSELDGSCAPLEVALATGTSYINGSAYIKSEPQEAQLAFRLAYDKAWLTAGVVLYLLKALGWIVIALFLFALPGYALLSLVGLNDFQHGFIGFVVAISFGMAIYPVIILWTGIADIKLGWAYAFFPPVFALVYFIGLYFRKRPTVKWKLVPGKLKSLLHPDILALALTIFLLFVARFLTIRPLAFPLWGDAFTHTMRAQLLVDNGGLFDSWQPYAPLSSFTYHFGFHAFAAVFHWASGVTLAQSIIIIGQFVNILAVLATAAIAQRISKSVWGAAAAIIVAGFIAPMPSYYVNWGRYTQLAGQAILPGLMIATGYFFTRLVNRRGMVLLAFGIAGLGLTHYRILIFYAAFAGIAWVVAPNNSWRKRLSLAGQLTIIAALAALLFLPQYIRTKQGTIGVVAETHLSTAVSQQTDFNIEYNQIGALSQYLPEVAWLALLMAAGYLLWQRNRLSLAIVSWWFALFLATNPALFNLPGSGVISNFALFIASYIPAGILIGGAIGILIARYLHNRWLGYAIAGIFLATSLLLTPERLEDLEIPTHALVTQPDLNSATWVKDNLPSDAVFLVNSFPAYGDSLIVGADAGWCLPLLAGRQIYPVIAYNGERFENDQERASSAELAAAIYQKGATDPEIVRQLLAQGVHYAYIGQQQGSVNWQNKPYLMPQELLASAYYRPVYHQDRVWIFEIISPNSNS